MNATFPLRRLAVPIATAVVTTTIIVSPLAVQYTRDGWPFEPRIPAPVMERAAATAGTSGSVDAQDRVPVDAAALGSLDIRLETVGIDALTQAVRAVATVVPDESRLSHAHTRVAGWVERLDVNTTGEMVRAGQPLARIFSQELLSSQIEYLAARKVTTESGITTAVVASGRTRLTVLGMSPAEIDAIEQSGEPKRLVTVVAPRTGVVVSRGITVGTAVDPSTPLLTVADLSRVWILAEVPEAQIPAVRVGTRAQLDFPGSGRPPFAARIDFVYPVLSERTRTLRVRLSAANPGGTLRPGLYGTAVFESAGRQAITVPRDAVVDTGRRQHVFVATGDRFEPREVTLGAQLAERVEVRAGLREGERIVAAGVFLLDSESRLRATGGAGGHSHGAPPAGGKQGSAPTSDPHAGHGTPAANPRAGHRE